MASAEGEGFEKADKDMAKEPRVKLGDVFKGKDGN